MLKSRRQRGTLFPEARGEALLSRLFQLGRRLRSLLAAPSLLCHHTAL